MHKHKLPIVTLFVCSLLFSGCGKDDEEKKTGTTGKKQVETKLSETNAMKAPGELINIGRMKGVVPAGWNQIPSTTFNMEAQFELTSVGDIETGEMSIFHFGPDAGSFEDNLNLWYQEFEQPGSDETSELVIREEFSTGTLLVILVSFTGTMVESKIPGAVVTSRRDNWMNASAIVISPDGPWFFKGTGPETIMVHHKQKLFEFVSTLVYTG